MDATARVAGETLILCPERAVYWPAQRMLLVADLHFAKAATFRAAGVFVPNGTTGDGLARLDAMIARHGPGRIIFLGDFLHAAEGRNEALFAAISRWRMSHEGIAMTLVRGNHDKRAGDPPCEAGIDCVDGPIISGPFVLTHHPAADPRGYVLAGHIHPCAVLKGRARERLRLPSFHFGERVGVLPAFGDFTGCVELPGVSGDSVWVVTEDSVERIQ